ncbi:MAG: hypothetical protein MSH60_09315 [Ruminococcus sp.]|nr:hypothetical protein [Ruminococcus sp.]
MFEVLMLICFGCSWPINVYKSYKSRSTAGKSLTFLMIIVAGYIFGIAGKIMSGNINYVLIFYLLNLLVVSADIVLYFRNKALENGKAVSAAA